MQKQALQFRTRAGAAWTPRFLTSVSQEICTHCGFCIKICPAGVFSGSPTDGPHILDAGSCRGCTVCERSCKVGAIRCLPLEELP